MFLYTNKNYSKTGWEIQMAFVVQYALLLVNFWQYIKLLPK